MRKYRYILIGIAILLIIMNVTQMNTSDLTWGSNVGMYLQIFAMIALIIAMILSNRAEARKG